MEWKQQNNEQKVNLICSVEHGVIPSLMENDGKTKILEEWKTKMMTLL